MIDNTQDIIDSRDVIERLDELEAEYARDANPNDASELDSYDMRELSALRALAAEGEDNIRDWGRGETLIRDNYFTEYARELVTELGYLPSDIPWWIVIDWEETADNLKADYTPVEFDGVTYWGRS